MLAQRQHAAATPDPERFFCTLLWKHGKLADVSARLNANSSLQSILLSNVCSLDNKLEYIRIQRTTQSPKLPKATCIVDEPTDPSHMHRVHTLCKFAQRTMVAVYILVDSLHLFNSLYFCTIFCLHNFVLCLHVCPLCSLVSFLLCCRRALYCYLCSSRKYLAFRQDEEDQEDQARIHGKLFFHLVAAPSITEASKCWPTQFLATNLWAFYAETCSGPCAICSKNSTNFKVYECNKPLNL